MNLTYSQWATAIGLVGLAVYQATQGSYSEAVASVLAALAVLGITIGQQRQADRVARLERTAALRAERPPGSTPGNP